MTCLVAQAAVRFGDSPALIDPTRTLTFRQFDQRVARAAAQLRESGIARRDRVGIVLPNSVDQIIVIMALIRIGAIACPISSRLPQQGVENYLNTIDSAMLITDDPRTKIDCCRIMRLSEIIATNSPNSLDSGDFSMDRPAVVIFTSGSTGDPKAVLLTLGNLYFSALGSIDNIPFGPGDRWLLSLLLYHVGGLGILFRALAGGGAVVVADQGRDIGDAILQHEVTHLSLVSTQLRRLLSATESRDLIRRHLKAVLLGGSGMPPELIKRSVERGLPIHTSYGLSEMASQVTTTPLSASHDSLRTSGRLLPYRQLRIAVSGEIEVRGETRFAGYVDGATLASPFDSDGWFATGDIGSLDQNGYLTVLGRRDTMFISGGENIYPEEIERALLRIDGILEAVVVPVADEAYGSRPCAFIRTEPPVDIALDRIRDELRDFLPAFKLPDRIFCWPEGTVGSGIKPDRRLLTLLAEKLTARPH
jgi:O-succinylbenzoic acid--CoA ligase